MAFLCLYRVLFSVYRALLIVYRALLDEHLTFNTQKAPHTPKINTQKAPLYVSFECV